MDPHSRALRKNTSHENEVYRKILRISYKDHVTNEEVRAKIQQAIGPHEDLPSMVKRRKLQWYGRGSRSSGLAKTILQGTVEGERRQGRQRKRREDNIREWTGLEFGKSQKTVENREKMEKTGCKIICDVPTTLAVKRLMLMIMRDGEIGVSGIFISKTYSLHCHHQNNSALRWEAVCAILMFH